MYVKCIYLILISISDDNISNLFANVYGIDLNNKMSMIIRAIILGTVICVRSCILSIFLTRFYNLHIEIYIYIYMGTHVIKMTKINVFEF